VTGPIPDKPEQLIEETEMLLRATAASEDFDRTLKGIKATLDTTPEQMEALQRRVMEMARRGQ